MRTRFLQAAFPGSPQVIIVRHPIAQALALRKWALPPVNIGLNLFSLVDHWFTAMDTFRSDRPLLERVHVVSYERLIANPEAEIKELFSALALPPSTIPVSSVADKNTRYADYWRLMQSGGPLRGSDLLYSSRVPLSVVPRTLERVIVSLVGRTEAWRIRREFSSRIAEYGYNFDDLFQTGDW
jgi:hypothetical protein